MIKISIVEFTPKDLKCEQVSGGINPFPSPLATRGEGEQSWEDQIIE
jgi:hypothetical protein